MDEPFRSEIIERAGRKFQVCLYYDNDSGPPWENEDGHGPMREINARGEKKPGEVIIYADDCQWAYDFGAAVKLARKDGWGVSKDKEQAHKRKLGKKPGASLTKGEAAVCAAQADYNYLCGWLKNFWWYCGVCVRILGPDDEPIGEEYDHALWGVDYDGTSEYWKEVATELADDILSERSDAWRKAIRGARERKYWEQREVMTA